MIKLMLTISAMLSCDLLTAQNLDPQVLVGTWHVDLRPTPDADPYFQTLYIGAANDSTFEGTFYYDSIIENASFNTSWGKLLIAFVTADGTGQYHTAARLEDGILIGTTHSIGRSFLSHWTAEKLE